LTVATWAFHFSVQPGRGTNWSHQASTAMNPML